MDADRRIRLWGWVVAQAHGEAITVKHVCAVAVTAANVDSVAVTVVLTSVPHETLVATDRTSSELEELALTLGEGPGADAIAGSPVLVADLTNAECLARWPVFAPAAVHAGVRAVFALPLQVGGIRLGAMSLYRSRIGDLQSAQLADSLVLTDTVCAFLLDAHQHDLPRLNGRLPELAGMHHPEVHQATGMITVQLGVSAAVALVRLRAYAYVHDRRLRDVAKDVVTRRLRFHPDP